MNNIDKQYKELLQTILDFGVNKSDRTGTGTKSVFGYTIRHNMQEGFPLLTTKKMAWKQIKTELAWFISGDSNIKFLVDNGCNIWNGDAYKRYSREINQYNEYDFTPDIEQLTEAQFIEQVKEEENYPFADLGPLYGVQWRSWDKYTKNIDQLANLLKEVEDNPDSRRLMLSAWNVSDLDMMALPPCHYGFQLYTRELNLDERIDFYNNNWNKSLNKSTDYFHEHMDAYGVPRRGLSLMWSQRSVDTFLGLPFNIASYGLLLELIAKEVNMMPDQLIGSLGDTHLYSNHLKQALEQITREPIKLPKLKVDKGIKTLMDGDHHLLLGEEVAILKGYKAHPAIKAPLSN